MAKKKSIKRQSPKVVIDELSDKILPQNIVEIGEHTQENKRIYISQKVYKEIHRFTKDKISNESGGVLLGNIIEEFGKTHIIIRAFIEAKYCEGTPTTLKFTHETWEYIYKEADKKYPNYKMLGWIHTHPDFGIFLSEYDKFIQENFFKDDNQIAYVVDPIQGTEGFYFWVNEKIERCKGFFIFDKTGVKITVAPDREATEAASAPESKLPIKNVLIGVLSVAVVLLFVRCLMLGRKVNALQTQMQALVESANNSLSAMSYQMGILREEIDELSERIAAYESQTDDAIDESQSSNRVQTNDLITSE